MKVSKKELSESKIEFTVVLENEEIKHAHDESVSRLSKTVKVKGFREGKVPKEVAEKAINPAELADEEINHAVNDAMSKIVNDENVQILDRPAIDIKKFVPGQTIEFKATVEIVPPIALAKTSGLGVKKDEVKIADKQITDVLENLAKGQSVKEKVSRKAENGDEVEIDFEGFMDAAKTDPFDGGKGEKYPLVLGSGSFIPGFEEGIIGHEKNDEFDLNVEFPENYGAKNLAGKKVVFAVKIREIREIKSPKIDDDFAKKMAPDLKTLDDLKNDIKRELTEQAEKAAQTKFENELIEKLAEKSKIPEIPQILIEDQERAMEQQFTQNLMYQGMSLEQYFEMEKLDHEKWVKRDLEPAAKKRVANSMVMAELAKKWDVQASEDEVLARREQILAQYSRPEIRKQFETPEIFREISQQVVAEKTLAKLASENK